MLQMYARKLRRLLPELPDEDVCALTEAAEPHPLFTGAGQDIVRKDASLSECRVLTDGFACRYKLLRRGERQITAFLLPGDACNLDAFVTGQLDQDVAALGPCTVAVVPHAALTALTAARPCLAQALWCDVIGDAAIAREWLVNVGRRPAVQRIAHVLCELFIRMGWIGMTREDSFDWPVVQPDLSDATGLSLVHTNRALGILRASGLIAYKRRTITICDWEGLMTMGGFDASYLQIVA